MTASPEDYQEQLRRLLDLVQREQARRRGYGGDDPREELNAIYDRMYERLRAAPDWHEPTPEEQAKYRRLLKEGWDPAWGPLPDEA